LILKTVIKAFSMIVFISSFMHQFHTTYTSNQKCIQRLTLTQHWHMSSHLINSFLTYYQCRLVNVIVVFGVNVYVSVSYVTHSMIGYN
jgi:hypothetical protein